VSTAREREFHQRQQRIVAHIIWDNRYRMVRIFTHESHVKLVGTYQDNEATCLNVASEIINALGLGADP
jgi:hypothetical protein